MHQKLHLWPYVPSANLNRFNWPILKVYDAWLSFILADWNEFWSWNKVHVALCTAECITYTWYNKLKLYRHSPLLFPRLQCSMNSFLTQILFEKEQGNSTQYVHGVDNPSKLINRNMQVYAYHNISLRKTCFITTHIIRLGLNYSMINSCDPGRAKVEIN